MSTPFQFIDVRIDGALAEVTLKRPQRRNALSQALMREMIRCARELSDRLDLHVVILRGEGSYFSAGADLHDAQAWAQTEKPLIERREIASLG
ncbi:MAG: enoyl-CoA hydratase/isomerase family protein, partial [Burkholderiales bacterium]